MNANGHLTDDELNDVLIGIGSREAQRHVGVCAVCAARTMEFTAAVASFNDATLAWSRAKSNTLTRDLTAGAPAPTPRLAFAAAGLCAATLAVAVGVSILPSHSESVAPQAQTAPVDRDREIARDDAMLQEIDAALYRPDPSPEQVYRLSAPTDGVRRHDAGAEVSE